MLSGPALGAAIEAARVLKRVKKTDMARHFGVSPPSIQDWVKRGTVDKSRLPDLWAYFADVVGPSHWGLSSFPGDAAVREPAARYSPCGPAAPTVEQALQVLGAALAALAPAAREELAVTLALWARYGGRETYVQTLVELLTPTDALPRKRRAAT